MALIRRKRKSFFGSVGNAYSLFSKENIPTQETYENLTDSIAFISEADDTAKVSEAGHIKLATDANAETKTDNTGDGHARTILPHMLPGVADVNGYEPAIGGTTDYSDEGIKITAVSKSLGGALSRLIYKLQVLYQDSIVMDAGTKALKLVGDQCFPSDGQFYGVSAGVKGWYYPTLSGSSYRRLIYNKDYYPTAAQLKTGSGSPEVIEWGSPAAAVYYDVDMTQYLLTNGDTLTIVSEFSRGASATNRSHWVRLTGSVASHDLKAQATLSTDGTNAYFIHTTTITRLAANSLMIRTSIENVTAGPSEVYTEETYNQALTWTSSIRVGWYGQDASTTSIKLHKIQIFNDPVL